MTDSYTISVFSTGQLSLATYGANLLNQYMNRTVPGAVDIMGVSIATNTVTVNGQTPINNTSALSTNITVAATGHSSVTGSMLVPKASETFWHDLDGNLLSDSLWTNKWNAESRLVQVESTTAVLANKRMREVWTHLPDGRWIERIVSTNNGSAYCPAFTNRFVWDGQVLMAILDHTNGLVMSFVRGLDLSGSIQGAGGVGGVLAVKVGSAVPSGPLAGTTHFVSYDGNGNVVALADASTGSTSGQFEYGPFSEAIRVTGDAAHMMPLRFSTMYEDSVTGDRKYLFRDLTPDTGRWKSRDPIGEEGGLSLHSVAHNNPVLRFDFLGLLDIKHIGEGFAYYQGPPEWFWLGLQARLNANEAGQVGARGIVISSVTIEVSISDCCGRCSATRGGNMFFLDRFRMNENRLAPFGGDSVDMMTDGEGSITFQPINISSSLLLAPCIAASEQTRGELAITWDAKLLPYSSDLWLGGDFSGPSDRGYDRIFWPEAAHKPFTASLPYSWGYFSFSQASYSMTFEWNNCEGHMPQFTASPHLPVGPQREGRGSPPGAIIYR